MNTRQSIIAIATEQCYRGHVTADLSGDERSPQTVAEAGTAAGCSRDTKRYPMGDMPFVSAALPQDDRFIDALEEFLISYGYNTARAYMADLLDIYDWAQSRQLQVFELTELTLKPYLALLRRRKYSENTIRRRLTAWRQFQASCNAEDRPKGSSQR